jgi:hypothetical protein
MRPHEPFSRDVLLQYITSSSKLAFRTPRALELSSIQGYPTSVFTGA